MTVLRGLSPSCAARSLDRHVSDVSSETAGLGELLDVGQAPRSLGWRGRGAEVSPWAVMVPRRTREKMTRNQAAQGRQMET